MTRPEAEIAGEVSSLDGLDRMALQRRWQESFSHTAPPRLSQILMAKCIAHNIQVRAYGGLPVRTIRALKAAAKAGDTESISPGTGTHLIREWNGVLHEVIVERDGYVWQGKQYRSLSAIARAITGVRWSGPRFFGLKNR
jgi:hypothetical protein